jgi:uracil-DNA glycosylase family 4
MPIRDLFAQRRGIQPLMSQRKWNSLNREIVACRKCERLIRHCQSMGEQKKRAFVDWDYWAQPVPNFGPSSAELLIVGLAPAAHGANRTGRMFTGDRSGDWLYRALHHAGLASQAESTSRHDGLRLFNCVITASCHCAPPDNKPTPGELDHCSQWMDKTLDLLPIRVFIALGQIAWKSSIDHFARRDWMTGRRPKFAHGAEVQLTDQRYLIGSYHPSQQNTFTGRLTQPMFDSIFRMARERLE